MSFFFSWGLLGETSETIITYKRATSEQKLKNFSTEIPFNDFIHSFHLFNTHSGSIIHSSDHCLTIFLLTRSPPLPCSPTSTPELDIRASFSVNLCLLFNDGGISVERLLGAHKHTHPHSRCECLFKRLISVTLAYSQWSLTRLYPAWAAVPTARQRFYWLVESKWQEGQQRKS